MKLLCFAVFITLAHSALSQNHSVVPYPQWPTNGYVVSIREYHSGIPTCTGVFISKNTVLTTARCLVCDEECKLKVFVYNGEKRQEYMVDSIATPPELDDRNPFGLIKIRGEAPEDFIVKVHKKDFDTSTVPMYAFRGQLHDGKFYFEPKRVGLLDNAKCTFTLGRYVPEQDFCAFSQEKFYFSAQDEGTPLMYDLDGKMHLFGIYIPQNPYLDRGARIIVYNGILAQAKWINEYTKIDDGCSGSYTFPRPVSPNVIHYNPPPPPPSYDPLPSTYEPVLPPHEPVLPPHEPVLPPHEPVLPAHEPVLPPHDHPNIYLAQHQNNPHVTPDFNPAANRVLPTLKPSYPPTYYKF